MQYLDVDEDNNRIVITMEGMFDVDEADRSTRDAVETFESMNPGFDVVVDAKAMKASDQEAAEYLQRSKGALSRLDVGTVVLVKSESVASRMQMNRVGERDYDLREADSVDAAHAMLDA
ncbi:hypothetical protein [Halomarina rubra]|uniref:STAS domain-containing protein n=1 Tax=Halomarina rubra TaxID=2071873 RepID=A0ABD6ARP8_9EURY|nr:hypothetical protein [Halomarina rubra]